MLLLLHCFLFYLISLSLSFTPTTKISAKRSTKIMSDPTDALLLPTVSLTSAAVEKAMAAAEREAASNGWKVTIAIADAGGVPLLVKRCDGAFAASYEIAVGKGKTAAQFCKDTAQLEAAANVTDGTSRAALLSAPFVLMRGGVPFFVNNICCGAVGVSGVKPDQDEQVALAAVNELSSIASKL